MCSVWIMFCLMAFYVALVITYIVDGSYWKAFYFLCALGINFAVFKLR